MAFLNTRQKYWSDENRFAKPYMKYVRISAQDNVGVALYDKKRAWIDFDARALVTNGFDMKNTAEKFSDYILSVACGEKTATERQDIRDIVICKDGVTL